MNFPKQILPLTSLRFVAAAMIVVQHIRGRFDVPEALLVPFQLQHGVAFFFILSGFILTYAHADLERGGGTGVYFVKRVARIWPAHVATFALMFLLLPPELRSTPHGYSIPVALANLALVQAWVPLFSWIFSFNSVSWSLSVEFALYLLFPFLIRNFSSTWPFKLAGALAFVLAIMAIVAWTGVPVSSREDIPTIATLVLANPLGNAFFFVLGMTTCWLWRRLGGSLRPGLVGGTALELAVLALVVSASYYSGLGNPAANYHDPVRIWFSIGAGLSCLPLAALIFTMALQAGLLSRLLSLRAFVLLGEISYSLYLVHLILVRCYLEGGPASLPLLGWFSGMAWMPFVTICLLVSYLIWSAIERPARRWLVGLATPRTGPLASSREIAGTVLTAMVLALVVVGKPTRYPNGQMVTATKAEGIYVIENDRKRPFPTWDRYISFGGKPDLSNVTFLEGDELAQIPLGAAMQHD